MHRQHKSIEPSHPPDGDGRLHTASSSLNGSPHARAAHALAVEDGLLHEEVVDILAGRRMVAAFPVAWGENPRDYAVRAVAEMMVAYLSYGGANSGDEPSSWGPNAFGNPLANLPREVRL